MTEETKKITFSEEEMKQLQDIQQGYVSIQAQFGQLKMAMLKLDEQAKRMNEQEITIEENLKSHQDKEKKFLDGITDKYGQGTLNPDTGVFTPDESKNKSE